MIVQRAFAVAAVALLASCVEPSDDNVSQEGPTTTTTEATTTTEEITEPVEVGRWTGGTSTDTENITVHESWELHWRISGDGFASVQWVEPGSKVPDGIRSLDDPDGSTLIRRGGTFYLDISLYGPESFEIWAVDVPN